ncbi:MAG: conjugal transfer protein TraF [Betaproteobacteria bacterium]|nr:conjugal transfer protein TraF [Betaproteobacteria bacterium]
MYKTPRALHVVPLALALLAGAAHAAPFGYFDPRSAAMGGTGVSAATSGNASYLNPALLSLQREKDRFSVELPIISVHAADPDKLLDNIDNLKATADRLTTAINQFNNAGGQTPVNSGTIATAIGDLRAILNAVSNKDLEVDLFAAPLTVGVPGKTLGVGVYASARADLGARFVYAANDDALTLKPLQDAATLYATSPTPATLAALLALGNGTTLIDPNSSLQSRFDLRGVAQEEIGVSLAHQFESLDNIAIGVTPKQMKYWTFDYSVNPQNANITVDQGRKDYSGSNFDLGIAKDLGSGFRAGLVGKNVISKSFTTALGNQIDLKPQYRAGISHHTDWTTVALDFDITRNNPVGLEKATQYIALGAEFNLLDWFQLRAGYRTDRTGNYQGLPSIGLGIALFGTLHVDAAIARRGNEEFMGALQLGVRF